MGFYDLSRQERDRLVAFIHQQIHEDILNGSHRRICDFFSDDDTYIRKASYTAVGKLYHSHSSLEKSILKTLEALAHHETHKVRQTVVNAAGEIGIRYFKHVQHFFDRALYDAHHSVRNAVIGSVKKMSQRNPGPVLSWAKNYLQHEDKEVRREICHGIELRGRTHPQDILPLLSVLQNDRTARVRNTLIHVLGQISYKKGCLETVIKHLNTWENKSLVQSAISEIIDVHKRYEKFAVLSAEQAAEYIDKHYNQV